MSSHTHLSDKLIEMLGDETRVHLTLGERRVRGGATEKLDIVRQTDDLVSVKEAGRWREEAVGGEIVSDKKEEMV